MKMTRSSFLLSSLVLCAIGISNANAQTAVTVTLTGNMPVPSLSLPSSSMVGGSSVTVSTSTSTVSSGKIQIAPFSITRVANASSPILFEMQASGKPAKRAVIKVGTTTLTLGGVYVSDIKYSAADSGGVLETVTFTYTAMSVTDGTTERGWSLITNTPWTAASTSL